MRPTVGGWIRKPFHAADGKRAEHISLEIAVAVAIAMEGIARGLAGSCTPFAAALVLCMVVSFLGSN